jgi:Ankyrin repeats (3 copies)/Ankyrin repeat
MAFHIAQMGIGSWFRRLFGKGESDGGGNGDGPSPPKGHWRDADDPGNPFGVRLLDLMQNLEMTSTTSDPNIAARAVSWRAGAHREIDVDLKGTARPCELRYPAPSELPAGMLYRPQQMEDKWVLAYRDGRVAAARSWTGQTMAVARARHGRETLVLTELTFAEDSGFDALGDAVAAFDWLVRTHALESRVPFPASVEGIQVLAAQPLVGFSLYGRHLFCAAVDYEFGEPGGRLHTDGDLVAAVAAGDAERLAAAIAQGAPVNAPCRFNEGATALHLAIHLHPELVEPLLAAGADVNAASLRGSTPLMCAASAGAQRRLLDRLIEAGADVYAADERGFAAVHVAAQFGRPEVLEALVEHGATLSATTERGLTPLHVAAGTGQRKVVEWLVAHGVDPNTTSPLGEPLTIAEGNGHEEVAHFLRTR